MRLRIFLPGEILMDEPVRKIIAEAENGCFCLEPRHVDMATPLAPGLLRYLPLEGDERCVGLDEGILVKCGAEVRVSTREAVRGDDPAALRHSIEQRRRELGERERQARSVLARLEAGVAKRFLELRRG